MEILLSLKVCFNIEMIIQIQIILIMRFLKKFIFAYVFTKPLGFVYDFKYWTAPIVVFIFYAFASIELIAEEIEDPFGTDANDLPLDDIAITIRTNVKEIATFD